MQVLKLSYKFRIAETNDFKTWLKSKCPHFWLVSCLRIWSDSFHKYFTGGSRQLFRHSMMWCIVCVFGMQPLHVQRLHCLNGNNYPRCLPFLRSIHHMRTNNPKFLPHSYSEMMPRFSQKAFSTFRMNMTWVIRISIYLH